MHVKRFLLQIILGVVLFDVSASIIARQKIRTLYGRYLNPRDGIGRGYPRYHHEVNEQRGFDIRPNSPTFGKWINTSLS